VKLNCQFSNPRVAVDSTLNQTALAVYEAYNGTSYNIVAHRFICTNAASAVCGDAVAEWSTTSVFATIDAGAPEAHAPQIVMDNSGNGIAVWEQNDGAKFRAYSNTFTAGSGTWGAAGIIDGGVGSESGYFNPVVAMANPGGAGSALSLFLGWSVLDNSTRLYYATGP
jgi:hypothetical protein